MKKLLVLFVHGLGGTADTWGSFEKLISGDPELGPRVTVAFYSFPTKALRLFGFWKSVKLQDIAQGLATEINHRYQGFDTILLVCHSMGGLIAKRYVTETLQRDDHLRVRGIIFFATPHSGSELARSADLLSRNHYHLRQLRRESDFLDLTARDWASLKCESKVVTKYVVAGQDAVVDPNSSAGYPGANVERIPNKGHLDVVKPTDEADLSFLIVKQTASRLLTDENEDFIAAEAAIERADSYTLTALIANKGRSWIETKDAGRAINILESVVKRFDPSSLEVIWSKYLLAIARLFLYGEASATAFDDRFVHDAEAVDLGPLIRAEKMEFARKRGDRQQALIIAEELIQLLPAVGPLANAGKAYAIGTAYFLLGNLFRFGGSYPAARTFITRAKTFFRPLILSHRIELAHCQYASAVCRAMEGGSAVDEIKAVSVGPEFRPFAEALLTLARSHSAWSLGRLGEAVDHADRASEAFDQIRFGGYATRARRLRGLLEAWRRLELGAPLEQAIAQAPEHAAILRGLLGDPSARGTLTANLSATRPAQVLGLLQFALAYSSDSTGDIGEVALPSILSKRDDGRLEWVQFTARSLAEADSRLRLLMGIEPDVRVPLIAD